MHIFLISVIKIFSNFKSEENSLSNFNGKLIMWSIVLMIFTFVLMDIFGFSALLGVADV